MKTRFTRSALALAFWFSLGTMLGQSAQDRVKTIAAVSFVPWNSQMTVNGLALDRWVSGPSPGANVGLFYALDLPEGSLVTGVAIEGCNATLSGNMNAGIFDVASTVEYPPAGASITYHAGCEMSSTYAPITGLTFEPRDHTYVISIYLQDSDSNSLIRAVRVYYQTQVGPPPSAPTFNDVPTTDPGFRFIEALAASGITAGCGGGNYCPDATLTRRQMAVFLAKGLGLGWPAN